MEENKEKVSDFYDDYVTNQLKYAYNERHFLMLEIMKKNGLKNDSQILEIGCGIGVISNLILKNVQNVKLFSLDISSKSIEIAKKNNPFPNVEFVVGDAVKYSYPKMQYDFITLFDVLEHIPVELHVDLFANIKSLMGENTKLLINIPTPEIIDFLHLHEPESLQVIDQALPADLILNKAYQNDLVIHYLERYDLWDEEYQIMVFKTKRNFIKGIQKPAKESFINKFLLKIKKRK